MTTGWYTHGHDTGHTNVNDDVAGPIDLDEEWSLRTKVYHDPVVRDGHIYVSRPGRQVSAFDVDGTGVWSYTHPPLEELNDPSRDQDPGPTSTPATDGEAVYHLYGNRCVSLDASDGTERWSTLLATEDGSPYRTGAQLGPGVACTSASTTKSTLWRATPELWFGTNRQATCCLRPSLTLLAGTSSTRTAIS